MNDGLPLYMSVVDKNLKSPKKVLWTFGLALVCESGYAKAMQVGN